MTGMPVELARPKPRPTKVAKGLPAAARKAARESVISAIADYIGTAGGTYATSEVARAGVAAELRRLGVNEHLAGVLAKADAERPLPSIAGLGANAQDAHRAGPYYRAAYLVRAAQRVQAATTDPERSGVAQLATEQRRYLDAHQAAQTARERGALRLDAASDTWGSTLGWYAWDDGRTTAECAAANGKNFDPKHPPAIGLPGIGPHVGCRCYAGPAHEGAAMMGGRGVVHPVVPPEVAATADGGDTVELAAAKKPKPGPGGTEVEGDGLTYDPATRSFHPTTKAESDFNSKHPRGAKGTHSGGKFAASPAAAQAKAQRQQATAARKQATAQRQQAAAAKHQQVLAARAQRQATAGQKRATATQKRNVAAQIKGQRSAVAGAKKATAAGVKATKAAAAGQKHAAAQTAAQAAAAKRVIAAAAAAARAKTAAEKKQAAAELKAARAAAAAAKAAAPKAPAAPKATAKAPTVKAAAPPAKTGPAPMTSMGFAVDSMEKATVHDPIGKPGGPGLWHHKGKQLPAYIQHVAKALMKGGMAESHAIATAVNTIKRWAAGGGDVHPDTRAAAAKALAEWEAAKAETHLAVQTGSVPVRSSGDGPRTTGNTAAKGAFLVALKRRKRRKPSTTKGAVHAAD